MADIKAIKELALYAAKKQVPAAFANQTIKDVNDALRARELIKLRVLDNSPYTAREAADEIAEKTGADVVQVVGSRFVLFKRNPKDPVIDIKL